MNLKRFIHGLADAAAAVVDRYARHCCNESRSQEKCWRNLPLQQIEKRTRKHDKCDASWKHAGEGCNRVVRELDIGQAEGVVEEIEREQGYQPGDCHHFPSVTLHRIVESLPPGAFQLPLDPIPGDIA